jgi:hypothetical protein
MSRKVAGLIPDEVIEFFPPFTKSIQPHYGSQVNSASNHIEYQESWGSRQPSREADNLTAICEPIV